MKNPNGWGTIKKLSGKRRRPYAVYVTVQHSTPPTMPKIDFLREFLPQDLYLDVQGRYEDYKAKFIPKLEQKQRCIGYYEQRTDAMLALAEYNKKPYDLDARNITFGEVYNIVYGKNISKLDYSSQRSYISACQKCETLRPMKMIDIRTTHLQAVIDEHTDKSFGTLRNIRTLFNAIYKFCLENDICDKDYAKFVKLESTVKANKKTPFTRGEIDTLWKNIDWETRKGMQLGDIVLIHIYTGMRPKELLALKKEHVHLKERYIEVHGTKTKAAKRIMPIHKKIMPLIEVRMHGKSELLFPDRKGTVYTLNLYRYHFFDEMCKTFGMHHTPHECRHTFATFANSSNMNRTLVKKMIGHASNDITADTYTHAFISDLVKEIDKLDI